MEVQESIKCGSSMVQEQQRIGRKIVLVRSAERCMHTATRLAHSKHRQGGDTRSPRPPSRIQSPMDAPRPRRFTRVSFTRGVAPKECVLRQAAATSEVHGPKGQGWRHGRHEEHHHMSGTHRHTTDIDERSAHRACHSRCDPRPSGRPCDPPA